MTEQTCIRCVVCKGGEGEPYGLFVAAGDSPGVCAQLPFEYHKHLSKTSSEIPTKTTRTETLSSLCYLVMLTEAIRQRNGNDQEVFECTGAIATSIYNSNRATFPPKKQTTTKKPRFNTPKTAGFEGILLSKKEQARLAPNTVIELWSWAPGNILTRLTDPTIIEDISLSMIKQERDNDQFQEVPIRYHALAGESYFDPDAEGIRERSITSRSMRHDPGV